MLSTMTEWLERQLEEEVEGAAASGQEEVECRMINASASLFKDKGDYDRALPMYEECLAKRKRVLGEDHPSTRDTAKNRDLCAQKHQALLSK